MIKKIIQAPEGFEQECTTVWSFPRRWNWATHNSKYRWNWSPEVVRNLIIRYSKEWDTLLEPMLWWWTTAIECKLLNRNLIAYDINQESVKLAKDLLKFESEYNPIINIELWDARKKKTNIKNESIDFVLTHPPYVDIIKYSDWKIKNDLSNIHDIDEFCVEIEKVAKESFRVLKKWKYCAILMWDTRRKKMYQPLAYKVMERFLKVWFTLKEDIIKVQHNCKATWFRVNKSKDYNFLLIMHEHLFIFKKL
jgi:DNA modification methylase